MLSTSPMFATSDSGLSHLWASALCGLSRNIKDFQGRRVLIEGAGYEKIWLETQPMGGEQYACCDLTAAVNNTALFLENQRADGRLPGSIMLENSNLVPQFNKFQGFCMAEPALNLWYWQKKPKDWLPFLQQALERWDAYLWRVRDTRGEGLLESWCQYDTGEDNALRYEDAPRWWTDDVSPVGCSVVPMQSMDVTGFSYSCRNTLSKIAALQGDEAGERLWKMKAQEVARSLREKLWDDARGAFFDNDKNGNRLPTLTHNTLRLMYWGAISPADAKRFVEEHLFNPAEFFTPFPLPCVAANDPLFRNNRENDWSGQPQGLTYQRCLQALGNYGMWPELVQIGQILLKNLVRTGRFVQQYDPFTGEPSSEKSGYGPTMLAAMGYIECLHGVRPLGDTLVWGHCSDTPCRYTLTWDEDTLAIESDGRKAMATRNGQPLFESTTSERIVTDGQGNVIARQSFQN